MRATSRSDVLVLSGATASGKTEFAIALAQRYGAEIVGADSRQIYRGMAIGTAAPTADQRARIPHHLIGFVDPGERYSAARFVTDALTAIDGIHARGKHAIVAGGTGFYLRALCGDIHLAAEPDPAVRARLAREVALHPVDVLHAWLAARDPLRAAMISTRDPYRIGRALEIRLAGAATVPQTQGEAASLRSRGLPFVKYALRTGGAQLADRIAQRTDAMLDGGLLAEADALGESTPAADAVGYREALAYLEGRLTYAELRQLLARATRRYAKRQLTWLRSEPDLEWIVNDDPTAAHAVSARLGWLTR